jgi:hypothetical protein
MAKDIKKDLIDFLRSEANSSGFSVPFTNSDSIGFEQYDGADEAVYITPVSEDPAVPGGGQTQYTGIDPGGDGGIADVVVSVQIDCWGGDRDDQIHADNDTHPDIVANELSQEVYRVLFEADDAAAGPAVPAGYDWINAEPPREADDLEQSPTKYRDIVVARMKYTKTP